VKVFITGGTLFFCIFFYNSCYSQSLSGSWKGFNEHSIWVLNPTATIMEVEISNDSIINGVIHNYYTKRRFEHVKINGTINWKDSIFNIDEIEEISHNISNKIYDLCLGKMQLRLTQKGNMYHLEGKWKDKSKKLFHCPTLGISFEQEIKDSVQSRKPDSLARVTDIQKVIELSTDETDSIKFDLYDNGEIDGDTASVYVNDSLIINRQGLSGRPIVFYMSFDKTKQVQKIKLFAHNLGSIPPNTALLVISTKRNRYRVTLSSNYFQTGSVEFFLKE